MIEIPRPTDDPEQRGARSRPWSQDEFIRVDGRNLVYRVDAVTQAITVQLPGRTESTPAALRRAGHAVAMPAQLRTSDFN